MRLPISPAARPSATVVVCTHTVRRWDQLCDAMEALVAQVTDRDQIVLVVDHDDDLLARARQRFAEAVVLANRSQRGLSGARNTGVGAATGDVVLFLDDDARPTPTWTQRMLEPFAQSRVIGVGGLARPKWTGTPPSWLPEEFLWVVGCSYRGLPETTSEVRNPIGAAMGFRREAFSLVGGFMVGLGRVGMLPVGCEETEFAIRVRRAAPDCVILHVPEAVVEHVVTPERATLRYFASRCWSEGSSKALVSAAVGRAEALRSERRYATRTLPSGVLAGLRDGLRGDPGGVVRAGAIVAGFACTAAGYVARRSALTLRDAPALDAPRA